MQLGLCLLEYLLGCFQVYLRVPSSRCAHRICVTVRYLQDSGAQVHYQDLALERVAAKLL